MHQVILEIKGDPESKDPGEYVERLEERYVQENSASLCVCLLLSSFVPLTG